jgi:hypothetical protein
VRRLLAASLCVVLAGCGSGAAGDGGGDASLWITRDRGETVLYEGEVDAGQTVLQALRSRADVETAYGGRFVEAIDGTAGSETSDWFYFLNGVAPDRGAAEVRLDEGDVAWWDYRRWADTGEIEVVVGAFPEPLLHGYGDAERTTVVRYVNAGQRAGAEAIGRLIRATSVARVGTPIPSGANVFVFADGPHRFLADAASPEGPYTLTFAGDALALARDPGRYRFRFEVP